MPRRFDCYCGHSIEAHGDVGCFVKDCKCKEYVEPVTCLLNVTRNMLLQLLCSEMQKETDDARKQYLKNRIIKLFGFDLP